MSLRPRRPTPEDASPRDSRVPRGIPGPLAYLGTARGALVTVGIFASAVGLATVALLPELRGLGLGILASGAAALIFLAMATLMRPRHRVARRTQRYELLSIASVLALTGIVALFNYVVVTSDVVADLTASEQYTLAPQTLDILTERLDDPVEATAFIVDDSDALTPLEALTSERMLDYLHQFERRSAGQFSYQVIDPERFPDIAYGKDVTRWPSVVFENTMSGARQTVVDTSNPEQDFLTALLVVLGLGQKSVYVLDGYSAWDLTEQNNPDAPQALGFALRGLERDSYSVGILNLIEDPRTPDDASLIIAAAPDHDLGIEDGTALNAYLEGGGILLALLQPDPPDSWRALIARWGIDALGGYVIDPDSHVAGSESTPLISNEGYLAADVAGEASTTFFPGLAPLWVTRAPENMPTLVDLKPIAVTSESSFASETAERVRRLATDLRGPFMVGVIARVRGPVDQPVPASAPITTVGVFGDADFISNRYFYAFSNSDLFLNTVNHMTGDEALVSIRPKPTVFREMAMTPRELEVVRYIGWFLLPLLVALLGSVVWWVRR